MSSSHLHSSSSSSSSHAHPASSSTPTSTRQQAYRLKSVRYLGASRRILLQNENGPCPLLAAANALLLRGEANLDPACLRSGVASADDVVNVLADIAAVNASSSPSSSHSSPSSSSHSSPEHEHRLDGALRLLPLLRRGMDVNPAFGRGPTGVERSAGTDALDLLGVELVHGWLLDPQDAETSYVVSSGGTTYNELVEIVVAGAEARGAMAELEGGRLMRELEESGIMSSAGGEDDEGDDDDVGADAGDDGVIAGGGSQRDKSEEEEEEEEEERGRDDEIRHHRRKKAVISDVRDKLSELSLRVARSDVAEAFLANSSHQLTHHGLERLHEHVADGAVCVFFRNNHFATLTRHDGALYLLVTDLGYANAPEIVWEKLDDIDGDTEYCDEYFARPAPRSEMTMPDDDSGGGGGGGPMIDPELMLARTSQAEADYQIALAMADDGGRAANDDDDDEDEDGRLMDAVKELSLKVHHGGADDATLDAPPGTDPEAVDMMAYRERERERSEHESEQLARQLQELDRMEYEQRRQRSGLPPAANPARARPAAETASALSNCTVS